MKYSLSREYLEDFLNMYEQDKCEDIEDLSLREIIQGALSYSYEVSLLVYFFAKRIQKKQNANSHEKKDLEVFYSLINVGFFQYQEFDRSYINNLFDYSRSRMPLTLEEIVIEVQQDLNYNKYDSDFRY